MNIRYLRGWGGLGRVEHVPAPPQDRLHKSGLTIVYLVEGDLLEATSLPYEALQGALVAAELEGAHVFRTGCVQETAKLLGILQSKMQIGCRMPTHTLATKKRAKDSDLSTIWVKQIACIPSFSETIARAILTQCGTLRDLQEALRAPAFPPTPISPAGTLLGKARLEKLRQVFA